MGAFTAVAPKFYNVRMNQRYKKSKLPLGIALISLAIVMALLLLTDPIQDVIYSVPFFVFFYNFILSVGYSLIIIQTGAVSKSAKQRLVFITTLIIILLMFNSSKSLNWVDALILILIGGGLNFYFNRR